MKFSFKLFLLCALTIVSFSASAKKTEIALAKIKLFNDLIEIKVPTHFSGLLDYEIKKNYSSDNLPKAALGDSLRESRLAFFSKKLEIADASVGALRASVVSEFIRNDLNLKELSSGITTVDGREVSYVGILHKSPEKFYRFYFLTVHQGLILSGELITPKKGYKNWIPVAEEIMNSLDIKGS
jgi:hypothetical protein